MGADDDATAASPTAATAPSAASVKLCAVKIRDFLLFDGFSKKTMIVLGIESSCDETGAALINDKHELLAQAIHTQIDMHRAYGGVVPELASRDHIRRAIALMDQVLSDAHLTKKDIDAIAVTEGPGLW